MINVYSTVQNVVYNVQGLRTPHFSGDTVLYRKKTAYGLSNVV